MHEMALTESLVGLIEDEARKGDFTRVKVVRLEVGALGQVCPDALLFCFDAISKGTVAEGAKLDIVAVPGGGWCMDCSKSVMLSERYGACPECGNYQVQVTSGEELRLRELEVE
jgi:hydrogenase nickel incorporation protein HypA/HybF